MVFKGSSKEEKRNEYFFLPLNVLKIILKKGIYIFI